MSASPPWMPLDVDDYLADTTHLSTIEHGAYFLLILRYWKDGGLPADEKMVARYAHLTAEQWSESRDVLAALFDEGWKHKRIDTELAKAQEIIGKRKSAGQQRHSTSSAHAEQVNSTSSYTGVPPLHKPLPDKPPVSVPVTEGARDIFDEVWRTFPQNPSSVEAKAEAAFRATKAKDQPKILAAAQRYAAWFAQDCEARKRTLDAGLRFVPHLSTWLEGGAWKSADALPVKDISGNELSVPMTKLDRERDRELWLECERLQGKPAPTSGMDWWFRSEIVDQARKEMAH